MYIQILRPTSQNRSEIPNNIKSPYQSLLGHMADKLRVRVAKAETLGDAMSHLIEEDRCGK